jgi:hypothetical protein
VEGVSGAQVEGTVEIEDVHGGGERGRGLRPWGTV